MDVRNLLILIWPQNSFLLILLVVDSVDVAHEDGEVGADGDGDVGGQAVVVGDRESVLESNGLRMLDRLCKVAIQGQKAML